MTSDAGIGDFAEKKVVARKAKQPPCKGCEKHEMRCHAGCTIYQEWLQDERARHEEIRNIQQREKEYGEYLKKRWGAIEK